MGFIPIQDLTIQDCRSLESQLKQLKTEYPKWSMSSYPENIQHFANYRTVMDFKFNEANVIDVIQGISIKLDPLGVDEDVPAHNADNGLYTIIESNFLK